MLWATTPRGIISSIDGFASFYWRDPAAQLPVLRATTAVRLGAERHGNLSARLGEPRGPHRSQRGDRARPEVSGWPTNRTNGSAGGRVTVGVRAVARHPSTDPSPHTPQAGSRRGCTRAFQELRRSSTGLSGSSRCQTDLSAATEAPSIARRGAGSRSRPQVFASVRSAHQRASSIRGTRISQCIAALPRLRVGFARWHARRSRLVRPEHGDTCRVWPFCPRVRITADRVAMANWA
jgi:hypothetical protein